MAKCKKVDCGHIHTEIAKNLKEEQKKMSKPILYGMDLSPPVRACLLTLKALDLPYEYKVVDLLALEHLSEDYLKMNPHHTVPLLDDNGTWIWDSHAICAYLVDKYGKTDELYPKDLAKRGVVNQRLFFEASLVFMSLRNISIPYFRHKVTVVPEEKTQNVLEAYDLLEALFDDNKYLTGDTLTIADFCCIATISSLHGIIPVDFAVKHPKTMDWVERMSQLPYYEEANAKGAKIYIDVLKNALTEIKY